MRWSVQTVVSMLVAVGCIVGGAYLPRVSVEGGVALIALGGVLKGRLFPQLAFAKPSQVEFPKE